MANKPTLNDEKFAERSARDWLAAKQFNAFLAAKHPCPDNDSALSFAQNEFKKAKKHLDAVQKARYS